MSNQCYIGRFAPSPTGPLHFGSLLAAVSSYAQARQQQGRWLVRIEDIDQPRCDPAYTSLILNTLDSYGMHWDGEIIYQSHRNAIYQHALDRLIEKDLIYGCACSRRQIKASANSLNNELIYPGTCRNGLAAGTTARSLRIRTNDEAITFYDKVQGKICQNINKQVGDFIIKRADHLFSYQIAVVVDDNEQGVTDIVRGSDMLGSTPRQIYLQHCLNYTTPSYLHIPLAVNSDGSKLSKQNKAMPIDSTDPRPQLLQALQFLRQNPPEALRDTDIETIWQWTLKHWSVDHIPAKQNIIYNQNNE